MNRRDGIQLAGAALLSSLLPQARADGPTRFGVLSLMGTELTVVRYQQRTGTHLDSNENTTVDLKQDYFDMQAVRLIGASINTVTAGQGKVSLYRTRNPALFQDASKLFSNDRLTLPEDLLKPMREDGVEQLVVLTRLRQPAGLQFEQQNYGEGSLEGLGFYVDFETRTRRNDTNEIGLGFLALYAYLRLGLVDLSTMQLIKRQPIKGSITLSAAHDEKNTNPWNALTMQQKVEKLMDLLDGELDAAVPKLLAKG